MNLLKKFYESPLHTITRILRNCCTKRILVLASLKWVNLLGLVLGPSQFLLLSQMTEKILLALKVIKSYSKVIIIIHSSKLVTQQKFRKYNFISNFLKRKRKKGEKYF